MQSYIKTVTFNWLSYIFNWQDCLPDISYLFFLAGRDKNIILFLIKIFNGWDVYRKLMPEIWIQKLQLFEIPKVLNDMS